jgi:hypothetical protein
MSRALAPDYSVESIATSSRLLPNRSRYICYASLIFVLTVFAAIRFHIRNLPLERDEGEYAYMGQLLLQGVPPYKLAYTMKLPGTCAAYAAMMALFGETAGGIRTGMIVVTTLCAVFVFLLGKRLHGLLAGTIAGVTYAFLAIRPGVLGMDGHATHFVVLTALAAILLFLRGIASDSISLFFTSGLMFGLAFVMKQPGIFFGLFAGCYWLWIEWKQRHAQKPDLERIALRGGALALGAALPYAAVCAWLLRAGVFANFWFWTWSYARAYGSIMSLSDAWDICLRWTLPWAVRPFVLWEIALAGLAAPLWSRSARSRGGFVAGFFITSLLAVCPGLYFRPHYFILLLPAIALCAGITVECAQRELRKRSLGRIAVVPTILFALIYVISVRGQWNSYFRLSSAALSEKFCADGQACPDNALVADFLKAHALPQDQVGIIGSEPEICFYTRLRCTSPYLYMYPLMEQQPFAQPMQADLMQELATERPRFIVYVDNSWSWNWRPTFDQNHAFLEALWGFAHNGYELVDTVPVTDSSTETSHLWGDRALTYVFQRQP